MNGYPDQQPSLALPPPNTEVGTANGTKESAPSISPEVVPTKESGQNQSNQALPPIPVATLPINNSNMVTAPQNDIATPPIPQTMLSANDDNDLIPKEWVIKAKNIIERTHEDPYSQNRALTKIKADYIQDRYKMTIKVEDD